MYLIFKRQRTTVFLSCKQDEDLELVKLRLAEATNQSVSCIQLRNEKNELYDEEKTLQELDLHEEDTVCFVFKMDNGQDWEDVEIEPIIAEKLHPCTVNC